MRADAAAIVFELEGTLVDSRAAWVESAGRCLADQGLAQPAEEEVAQLLDGGPRAFMLALLARRLLAEPALADRVQPEMLLGGFERHCCSLCHTGTAPRAGAADSLRRLSRAGVRLACLSEHDATHANCLLRSHRLDEGFALVAGHDSQPFTRGDPRLMRQLCTRLGAAPGETVFVGSRNIDREAARAAGLRAWAVSPGRPGSGHRGGEGPQRRFDDLPALAGYVLREAEVPA